MDISVIIVNYNTKELLKDCINSIIEKTLDVEYEIIVSDNQSTDGSLQMLSNDFPEVIQCANECNLGFGRANNRALELASGEYVFFLNSDTTLLNNGLKIFMESFKTQPETTAALGCCLLDRLRKDTHSYGRFPKPTYFLLNLILRINRYETTSKIKHRKHHHNTWVVDYITGAALFVPRAILLSLGSFDPDFFLYFEETELQYRYNRAGKKMVIIEGPEIVHLEGQSLEMSCKKKKIFFSSYIQYLNKTLSSFSFKLHSRLFITVYILLNQIKKSHPLRELNNLKSELLDYRRKLLNSRREIV